MKLHSLDISGFKSFVDPVSLKFAGGITAIVGPNGCGKSNLSDAITWVLGEQSAKSLRGSKMEDVIFSGSAKRKPLGMAEVSLTLTADSSIEAAVDGKITLGRRVFRTGESQYRLNGKVVRLKQIKDLLMDTGLGIRAYSVIEQGKIGMILSGKPQERRKLLEEAAGITRYKARKRIAELKLEETTANLLRLDDIISEVERSLRSLKRQASAARRYKSRRAEYETLLKQVLLGRWALLSDQLGDLDGRLADLVAREAELSAVLHDGEASLAEGRQELDVLAEELAARHEKQAELAATIEGRQEFLKGARQRSEEVGERLLMGRSQAEEQRRQTSDYKDSLGNLDERSRDLLGERDEAARKVAEDDEKIAACQKRVEEAAARSEELRKQHRAAVADRERLNGELRRSQVEMERRTYRQRFLNEEHERLAGQLNEATTALETADGKIAELSRRLEQQSDERTVAGENLEQLLGREADANEEARRLETHLAALEQRRRILVELSEEHAERRRALADTLAETGVAEPRYLADLASPLQGWEEVIDSYLGEMADAVVLSEHDDALALARRFAELGSSGIFLRPLPEGAATASPRLEDPAIVHSLTDALGLPAELARSLPPVYLVEAAGDAERLAAAHPGVAFVSQDRLWAQGGSLHVWSDQAAPGVLARESELEAIGEDIPRSEEELRNTRQTLEELVAERTKQAAEIHRLEEEIAELKREVAVTQARRQDVQGRHQKLSAQNSTITTEQAEIGAELEKLTSQREELSAKLAAAEQGSQDLETGVANAQQALETAKEEREALRTEGAGRRGRLELLEERLESHVQETQRIKGQITYSEQQLTIWSEEDQVLQRRLRELETSMKDAESKLQGALEQRAGAQEAVLEQQALLDRQRDQIRDLEEKTSDSRMSRETLRDEIGELRVERAGVSQDSEHLSSTYREEFKKAIPGTLKQDEAAADDEASEEAADTAAELAEHDASPEETASEEAASEDGAAEEDAANDDSAETAASVDELVEDDVEIPQMDRAELTELETEMARCKGILERIGPVNVLAADEYEEQLERESFLATQRKDVAESVRRLQDTIAEINSTSSERFRETFAQVNARFGELFTRLFRGGEAEMRLFDEEDILETGIEIIARPPGKRPQNIMLLSGGEKALTAIALLFALFETKPSPFCILDEVDAPLDDVNVLRFVETLKELALDTQFLIVTHNKLTMEVASTLYGVTMEERGVSKLVSVELENVQPEEQAATA